MGAVGLHDLTLHGISVQCLSMLAQKTFWPPYLVILSSSYLLLISSISKEYNWTQVTQCLSLLWYTYFMTYIKHDFADNCIWKGLYCKLDTYAVTAVHIHSFSIHLLAKYPFQVQLYSINHRCVTTYRCLAIKGSYLQCCINQLKCFTSFFTSFQCLISLIHIS